MTLDGAEWFEAPPWEPSSRRLWANLGTLRAGAFALADLPSITDVLTGELSERGRWIVANLVAPGYWTIKLQSARYQGQHIFLLPLTREGTYPAIASLVQPGQTDAEVRRIMSRFLSALCWAHHTGAIVERWTGGTRPFVLSGFSAQIARTYELELDYLPDPPDDKGRLALALCREAGGVNVATYAVISYFRVFETHFQGVSRQIKEWINANLEAVTDSRAVSSLQVITAGYADVGAYLYDECRSAGAHGKIGAQTVIDPDNPEDEVRLERELPLIRALAVKLTEEILGVQTTSTIFKEHLYELAGFKAIFGDEAVSRFSRGEPVEEGRKFDLPIIDIGLMERRVFPSLCSLKPVYLGMVDGGVQVIYQSDNRLLTYKLVLDFRNERLLTDDSVSLSDDGSVAAAEIAADITDFLKFFNLNGRLRINNSETGELLSRKEAYMPVNVIINPEGFDAEVTRWRAEAERRAQAWGRGWQATIDPASVKLGLVKKYG